MVYDLFVMGGGPAGYVASIRGSQLGMKVAIAEEKFLGGTCTNVGCIPTKAWLASSELFQNMKESKKFGVTVENFSIDMKFVKSRTDRVVMKGRKGIEYLLKKNGVDLITGHAIVDGPNKAHVGDKTVEFKNLLLAQGSHPIKFPPFNVDGVMTSDEIFSLDKIPSSILIVGGGVIGVEMANFFSSIGSEVTVVEVMDHVLPNMDGDVAEVLTNSMKKRGIELHTATKTLSVDKVENGFKVIFEEKERFEKTFEMILLSVGRKSNVTDDIKALGVAIDPKGNVITTDEMKTNISNIYAAGDINGKYMLAHVASREGIVAVTNMKGGSLKMDYRSSPSVIFTTPEIGNVGYGEDELKKAGVEYKKSLFPMTALGRARTLEFNDGFGKILTDKNGIVIGVTIVGPMATEVLMEGVMAVHSKMNLENLLEYVHPHPTISEIYMEASDVGMGMPIDI
jgi:dihydrolipoamide dehydrogenase